MGLGQDSVDRAFALILSDDRRKLTADDEAAAKRLWRRVFAKVHNDHLLAAVQTWLTEKSKGRPNVGEIQEILRRSAGEDAHKINGSSGGGVDVVELRWAVRVLEASETTLEWGQRIQEPAYRHTLEYAQRVLKRYGHPSWQAAKGVTTTTTMEAIL